jgi:uncharacterized membrane protein YqhA
MLRFALMLRHVMLIASLGTGLGALVMFWEGSARMLHAAHAVAFSDDPKAAIAHIMAGTDAFLFGIVLTVFAYTIAFGFVFDLSADQRRKLPAWMQPTGMTELKTTLVGVIIVYLVVDFATDWAESNFIESWLVLVKPISILLLAVALRVLALPESEPAPNHDA